MKNKIFTRLFTLIVGVALFGTITVVAQNLGTGTGWGNLTITKDIVIDEDFTGYEFLHSRDHANQGNSKDIFDEGTFEWTWGHRNQIAQVPFTNYTGNATFHFDTCAFAPQWGVAASVNSADGTPVEPDPTTEGVSKGFVEVSRDGYGDKPGFYIIDLRELPYVEAIQFSHSSAGGKRRGFTLLYSLNDSASWDTLRSIPGDAWDKAYNVTNITTSKDTVWNSFNAEPSASGMLWEDEIKASNVMLKFTSNALGVQQAVRIHDLKVYGGDAPTAINDVISSSLIVSCVNNQIIVSKPANVEIISCSGAIVKSATVGNSLSISDVETGIYIVKASTGNESTTVKIIKE